MTNPKISIPVSYNSFAVIERCFNNIRFDGEDLEAVMVRLFTRENLQQTGVNVAIGETRKAYE